MDNNNLTVQEEFIAHYGKIGMRWGHRKAGNSSSEGGSAKKKEEADAPEHTAKVALLQKPVRKVTNAELKAFQERINLEKPFNSVKQANSPSGKVDRHLKTIFALTGTVGAIYGIANSPWMKSAIKVGKKAIQERQAVREAAVAIGKAYSG